ncbi:MAG: HlyD family type I secretion periplasmic adaptor subunit [Rhodospirillaceae bacterium]|nr:HlyD family type I secretion periplasmic adaptor subunit [Rhodospirillaceae bacterium]
MSEQAPSAISSRPPSVISDFDFADEIQAALHQGPRRTTHLMLLVIVALFAVGFGWAAWATIDEVTRGQGRVVPSRQMQVVQTLEPGIIEEILVAPGDLVDEGQILIRVDDTGLSSQLGELEAQRRALQAQIARLQSELNGEEEPVFPEALQEVAPSVIADETELFHARRLELENQLNILRQQAEQREQELQELRAAEDQYATGLGLAQQELGVYATLSPGVVPRVEILQVQQRVNELSGQLEQTRRAINRAEAAIREAHQRIEDQFLQFRAETRVQLNQHRNDLAVIEEGLRGATDRVVRTDIRSPVDGIVNRVNVTTVGGVVQPSQDLIEIVPIEDSLLIEARIRPSDVAFLRPGLPATVKITAYDYASYGGLQGSVERISADTIVDEETGESFYEITVRTESAQLGNGDQDLPIIPGMIATVDILTGHRTILEYLLHPLERGLDQALTE